MLRAVLSLGVAVVAMTAAPAAIHSDDQIVDELCKYISINTTNPPGNEKAGAEYLAGIIRDSGLKATVYDTAPGRACVYAKLQGSGKKRPLILLNHIDVVPANAEDWTHPPFEGKVYNAEIWGRGAVDMKGMGIAELEAFLAASRMAHRDRDIIFLGTPDEEVGGPYGAEWITKNHPELVRDAEYLLNEGYFIDAKPDGTPKYWGVDVGEKNVLWLKLTATGDAGHASMPMPDSAPNRLVRALTRVVNAPPAPEVMPAAKTFFETISASEPEPLRSYYKNIVTSVQDPHAYEVILQDKLKSSMLRNTVSLTVLKSGYKTNVIPGEATAELDCRLLPGTDKDQFVKQFEEKLADPAVKVSVLEWQKTNPSSYDTELFKVIADVSNNSGSAKAPVVPVVVPWFTDCHWFRDFGTTAYGFVPFRVDQEHLGTMHGKNERVQVRHFVEGVHLLTNIVEAISNR